MGAVGAMCIEATRDVVKTGDFDEYLLADKDEQKLKKLEKELDDDRVKTITIDATDEDAVAEAIEGYEIVMDGLPFALLEPTVRACLKQGIPHLDLGSRELMFEYGKDFEEAGTLAVGGVGMTPGLTDVMAKFGAGKCDNVDEVYVYWAAYRPFAISPGLIQTTYWEMHPETEERAYYENGGFHHQPPLEESRTVEFEPPYGEIDVYYVPHSETYTLPRAIPEVDKVETMGTWPPQVMDMLKQMVDYGFFEQEKIEYEGKEYDTLDLFGQMLYQLPGGQETPLWGYALHVEVLGDRDGREVKCTLTHSHPPMEDWGGKRAYAKNVAIPLSIGAQLIAEGKAEVDKGYVSAFEVFDPEDFFQGLSERGIEVHVKKEENYKIR